MLRVESRRACGAPTEEGIVGALAGHVLKWIGDGVLITTIVFVSTVAVVLNVAADWPEEILPMLHLADFLRTQFGVAWWGVVTVLGVLFGWAIGGVGRREVTKAGVRWGGYH